MDDLSFGVTINVQNIYTGPYEFFRKASEERPPSIPSLSCQSTELALSDEEDEYENKDEEYSISASKMKTFHFEKGQSVSYKVKGKWVSAKVTYVGIQSKFIKIDYKNESGSQEVARINECQYDDEVGIFSNEIVHDNKDRLDSLTLKMEELLSQFEDIKDELGSLNKGKHVKDSRKKPMINNESKSEEDITSESNYSEYDVQYDIDINKEIKEFKDWL